MEWKIEHTAGNNGFGMVMQADYSNLLERILGVEFFLGNTNVMDVGDFLV